MQTNSDFDKYVDALNEITNQENRAELEGFYVLHASTLQFFKAIDKTVQDVLSKTNVGAVVLEQLRFVLPALNKLKNEITKLDKDAVSAKCKTNVNQMITLIKNEMTISEINDLSQQFFDLLKENKTALVAEQKGREKENKQKKAILDKSFRSCPRELLEGITVSLGSNGGHSLTIPPEVADRIETYLKTKILSGQYITYEECNYILDVSDNLDVWKAICRNYIQPKLYTAINILKNWKSVDAIEYMDLIVKLVESCVTNDWDWGYVPYKFLKKVIISSENVDAMIAIWNVDLQEPNINKQLLDEIKNLAKKRHLELTNQNNVETQPKKKSGCFVATACYGNNDAPEVLVLRAYRDEQLLTNWLGTAFVKFYYFVSPPLARQIEKSDKVKNFIRKWLLQPIVNRIKN
jgi:hypothetical protein